MLIKGVRRRILPPPVPATLSLDGWWQNYITNPWAGTASLGTSASWTAVPGSPPGTSPASATLNGNNITTWDYTASQFMTTTYIGNLVSQSSGFAATMIYPTIADADQGAANRSYNRCIWSDGNPSGTYIGMGVTTTGPFAYIYGGSGYNSVLYNMSPLNQWMVLFMWWDGTKLYLQVNNNTPVSVNGTLDPSNLFSNTIVLGRNMTYGGAQKFFGGQSTEFLFSKTNLSAQIPTIYNYFKTKYPSAGLP